MAVSVAVLNFKKLIERAVALQCVLMTSELTDQGSLTHCRVYDLVLRLDLMSFIGS